MLDVIADLEAYPEWTGEIKNVTILAEEGDGWPDRVEMTMDAGVIRHLCPGLRMGCHRGRDRAGLVDPGRAVS